jgi:hypothetical protein
LNRERGERRGVVYIREPNEGGDPYKLQAGGPQRHGIDQGGGKGDPRKHRVGKDQEDHRGHSVDEDKETALPSMS